jgi:hypothetical protein
VQQNLKRTKKYHIILITKYLPPESSHAARPDGRQNSYRSKTITELRKELLGKLSSPDEQKLLTLIHNLSTAHFRLILRGSAPPPAQNIPRLAALLL